MLSAYAPLFRVPGATRFIAGTALSRTGGAMFGVAVIVMLSERRGSFGLAGAVSAVGLLVLAIAGPVIGRLVDKHGQRRVALPFVLFSAVCGVTVAVLSWRDAPAWSLFVFYGLSAVLPEPGPMSRARWAHIYRDEPDRLHTAMSFEQVADEASFVVGPVLAVLVSTLWFPEAGLLVAELLFTAGMLAFLAARATEPPVVPHADRPGGLAVRRPGPARRGDGARHDRRHLRRQRGHRGRLRHRAGGEGVLERHPRRLRPRVDPRRHRVRQPGCSTRP